jgi:Signal transduction histidine kinase
MECENQTRKFEMIQSATRQMGSLVNDLLQLELTDLRENTVSEPSRELSLVVEDVRKVFAWLATEKGIQIKLEVEPNLFVKMDESDLVKVVRNLMENALRYTPNGGSVSVSAVSDRSDVVIKFTDTGIGISPSDLPKVFDRFWRADKARSRSAGGNGLGLSITKAIVTQFNGTVEVESKVDIGSIFTVRLPLVRR